MCKLFRKRNYQQKFKRDTFYENSQSCVEAEEVGLSPGTIDNYISETLKFIRKRFRNEILLHFCILY